MACDRDSATSATSAVVRLSEGICSKMAWQVTRGSLPRGSSGNCSDATTGRAESEGPVGRSAAEAPDGEVPAEGVPVTGVAEDNGEGVAEAGDAVEGMAGVTGAGTMPAAGGKGDAAPAVVTGLGLVADMGLVADEETGGETVMAEGVEVAVGELYVMIVGVDVVAAGLLAAVAAGEAGVVPAGIEKGELVAAGVATADAVVAGVEIRMGEASPRLEEAVGEERDEGTDMGLEGGLDRNSGEFGVPADAYGEVVCSRCNDHHDLKLTSESKISYTIALALELAARHAVRSAVSGLATFKKRTGKPTCQEILESNSLNR